MYKFCSEPIMQLHLHQQLLKLQALARIIDKLSKELPDFSLLAISLAPIAAACISRAMAPSSPALRKKERHDGYEF